MTANNTGALTRLVRLPAFLPWALLVVLTGFPGGWGRTRPARFATVAVLLVAFFKVGTVGATSSELRKAPLALELIFNAWCVLVCAVLIVLYLGS